MKRRKPATPKKSVVTVRPSTRPKTKPVSLKASWKLVTVKLTKEQSAAIKALIGKAVRTLKINTFDITRLAGRHSN